MSFSLNFHYYFLLSFSSKQKANVRYALLNGCCQKFLRWTIEYSGNRLKAVGLSYVKKKSLDSETKKLKNKQYIPVMFTPNFSFNIKSSGGNLILSILLVKLRGCFRFKIARSPLEFL